MSKVALVVDLKIAPGKVEQFLERVRRHAEICLAREPGCERFDVLVPQDGGAEEGGERVFLYELYADQAAVEAHLATPHMAEYLADTKPMIAERVRTACTMINR